MNVIAGRRKNFVYNNYARVSTDAGWKQNERRRKTRVVVRPRVLGTVQRTVSPQPKLYFSRARPSILNRYLSIAREKGDKRWLALLERNGATLGDSVPTTINIQLVPSWDEHRVPRTTVSRNVAFEDGNASLLAIASLVNGDFVDKRFNAILSSFLSSFFFDFFWYERFFLLFLLLSLLRFEKL